MPKLSVVIINYNESKNMAEAIKSAQFADEIIVVDGESRDDSVEVAKELGARVFVRPNEEIHNINRVYGVQQAQEDWIFILDTDERITKELEKEITQVVQNPGPYNGFSVPRKNFYSHNWLRHGGLYPNRTNRLFKKGTENFPLISPHESFEIKGKVGELQQPFLHYAYKYVTEHWGKNWRYALFDAQRWHKEGIPSRYPPLRYLIKEPLLIFWSGYFKKRGFLDGFYGLVFWVISALTPMIAYLKYRQQKQVT